MKDLLKDGAVLYEDNGFAQECLDAFDARIAEIEKEYVVTSKSA